MPDVWKPKHPWTYEDWAEAILEHGKDVTQWEQSFTKSIRKQLDTAQCLTQRQAEILERIYTEKT